MDVRYLIVHCSASKATAKVTARDIDHWHRQRGFRKIGYHYVILRDGLVEGGRLEGEAGAHAIGYNDKSIGICLVGGLGADGLAENNFTHAQFAALQDLLETLLKRYPRAQLLGHRDLPGVRKDCPSFDVRAWWTGVNT